MPSQKYDSMEIRRTKYGHVIFVNGTQLFAATKVDVGSINHGRPQLIKIELLCDTVTIGPEAPT